MNKTMKVTHYIVVYNESKIIPLMRKYWDVYDSMWDYKLIVYDNKSTDDTVSILSDIPYVEIRTIDSNNELNDKILTDFKNSVWKEQVGVSDWVIVSDTDEIIWTDNWDFGDSTIIHPHGRNYVFDSFPIPDSLIHVGAKYVDDDGWLRKCVLFKPSSIREINYCPGAHACSPTGDVKFLDRSDIHLMHFNYLSEDYMVWKYMLRKERLSRINKDNGWGCHYDRTEDDIRGEFRNILNAAHY